MDSRKLFETITGISDAGFGYIVLRDIPKQQAQIDTVIFPIKGGFRGFQLVPAGPHYVSVTGYRGDRYSFWCYLRADDVIVKVLDPNQSAANRHWLTIRQRPLPSTPASPVAARWAPHLCPTTCKPSKSGAH